MDLGIKGRKAIVTESGGIAYDSSGEVEIQTNDSGTTDDRVTAHLNWMHGNQSISESKECVIEWFADEDDGDGQWVIVSAECE